MPFGATGMKLEIFVFSEVRKKESNTVCYHLYLESNKLSYLWKRNKLEVMENRVVVAKGEGKGVGWTGNWGLVDANYCIWSG